MTGDSTADTVASAQTGKNAVENNSLNKKGCSLDPLACREPLIEGGGIRGGGISAKTPTGSKGNVLKVQDGSNKPTTINDRQFSGHALERMQKQGITPSFVDNAIKPENAIKGKVPGTTAYHDKVNNITIKVNENTGRIVTDEFG
ncbi:VENN motif pre-toxin domain-containing protein, partial [Yersinia alsatica]|uniref:VENN motif pre-toxin domain-containing protein n=1 Tax=Yersinia alsatica TaxID=2890317 RepID=UPI00399F475F